MKKDRFQKRFDGVTTFDVFSDGHWLGWEIGREGCPVKKCGELVVVSDSPNFYYEFPVTGELKGRTFFVSENGPHAISQEKSRAGGRFAEDNHISSLKEGGKVIKVTFDRKFRYTVTQN